MVGVLGVFRLIVSMVVLGVLSMGVIFVGLCDCWG